MFDWLIVVQNNYQFQAIVNHLFIDPQSSPYPNVMETTNCAVLKGRVGCVSIDGALVEADFPEQLNPWLLRKQKPVQDDWGFVLWDGWQSLEEQAYQYPVNVLQDSITYHYKNEKQSVKGNELKHLFSVSKRLIIAFNADMESELLLSNWLEHVYNDRHYLENKGGVYRTALKGYDALSVHESFHDNVQRYGDFQRELGQKYQVLAPRGWARQASDYAYAFTWQFLGKQISEFFDYPYERFIYGRVNMMLLNMIFDDYLKYQDKLELYKVKLTLNGGSTVLSKKSYSYADANRIASQIKEHTNNPYFVRNSEEIDPKGAYTFEELLMDLYRENDEVCWSDVIKRMSQRSISYVYTSESKVSYRSLERVFELLNDGRFNGDFDLGLFSVNDERARPYGGILPLTLDLLDDVYEQQVLDKVVARTKQLFKPKVIVKETLLYTDLNFNEIFLLDDSIRFEKDDFSIMDVKIQLDIEDIDSTFSQLFEEATQLNIGSMRSRDKALKKLYDSNIVVKSEKGVFISEEWFDLISFLKEQSFLSFFNSFEWETSLMTIETWEDARQFIAKFQSLLKIQVDKVCRLINLQRFPHPLYKKNPRN